jgi:phage shock protein A
MEPAEDPRRAFPDALELRAGLLEDLQAALRRLREAQERLAERARELGARRAELDERARHSLAAGDEPAARAAVGLHRLAGAELDAVLKQLGELEAATDRLALDEQRLAARIEAYEAHERLVGARYDVADARVRIAEALAGLDDELGRDALAEAEEKAAELEARAEAIDALLADGTFGRHVGGL